MKKKIQEALRAIELNNRSGGGAAQDFESAIFMRLAALSRKLLNFHADVLRPEGLSHSEYQLLSLAWSLGPQAPKELNRLLLLTSGALTSALHRLQDAGHIRRRRNPDDARSVLVELTAGGARLAERLVALEREAQARQLNPLSTSERRSIVRTLDQLIDVL